MVERITAEEAKRMLDEEGYVYVDVRSIPEFEGGHPRGAFNVPLMHMGAGGMEPNAEFMRVIERHFAKDAKLVVGCKAGGRSLRAAEMLHSAGFTNVVDQRAGWDGARDPFGRIIDRGWSAAGLPVATRAEPGHSYDELAKA